MRACLAPAAQAVAAGTLPCSVIGIADSSGVLGIEVLPGPRTPRLHGESIFFLASVTKPIVATAVMRLVDAGAVDLDAPVQSYVPAFKGEGKSRVSVRHVLSHTAGIADLDPDLLRRQRPSAPRMLGLVCTSDLRFEPGTRYEYCSASFFLLAEILARATGLPFPAALRRLVLDPVGMTDISFDPRYARSRIVTVEGVPLRNFIVRELTLRFLARATLPGGGTFGTAADLLAFGRALLRSFGSRDGLLSDDAVTEMTTEQTAGIVEIGPDGARRDPKYALGWGKPRPDGTLPSVVPTVAVDPEGDGPIPWVPASARAFTHGGATGTRIWVDPERDLVFVFLTNLWGASDAPMFDCLAQVYRELPDQRSRG
ncbi:serine hydrolase domain-containing protein [soil metagenome]